jgi:hypothetical protein
VEFRHAQLHRSVRRHARGAYAGAKPGTWDVPINGNSGIIDGYIGGVANLAVAASNIMLPRLLVSRRRRSGRFRRAMASALHGRANYRSCGRAAASWATHYRRNRALPRRPETHRLERKVRVKSNVLVRAYKDTSPALNINERLPVRCLLFAVPVQTIDALNP